MKLKKRIIALCICALAIGIAIALPLTYFTPLTSANAQTAPFFNPSIDSLTVYFPKPGNMLIDVIETPDGITAKTGYGATFGATMRYTIPHATTDFKNADAKIDLYKFHFYSDQVSLVTTTQAIAVAGKVHTTSASGDTFAITGSNAYENTFTFADGTVYDFAKIVGSVEDSVVYCLYLDSNDPYYPQDGQITIAGGARIIETGGEKAAQILSNIENAQTIYVDITRILSVTYKHSNNPSKPSIVTTTLADDNELLYHIELSKTDVRRFSYEPFVMMPQDAILTFSDGTSITGKATNYGDAIALKETDGDLELQIQKAQAGDVIVTLSDGSIVRGTAIPYVGGIIVKDTVVLTGAYR
jgi:hypothetical protein